MKKMDLLKLEELRLIEDVISEYTSMEKLKSDLDTSIASREENKKQSLNVRFNMDMLIRYNVFDPWELKVVKSNHITNLQELIDCNLDELTGITPSIKEGLEWVRKFYDMSSFEDNSHSRRK